MNALKQRFIPIIGSMAIFAVALVAQPVIVSGTGNPDVDVPAVQAAVDQGGAVTLIGHFSFDRPPNTPAGAVYSRMVTVSKDVVLSGSLDANGDLPTIRGGNWPFLIDAAGAKVVIQGVHFVGPSSGAIWVYAVGGLTVMGCRVQGIHATTEFQLQAAQPSPVSNAIFVGADPHPPSATQVGKPDNFSGSLTILNNDFDVAAVAGTQALGIVFFNVGRSADKEAYINISGNRIRNVNEPAINLRVIGGRVYVGGNVVATGDVSPEGANPDVIRLVGSGSYLIAHNSINCSWQSTTATGINVIGQAPPLAPQASAVIIDNLVTMSAPEGTVFGANSAGIQIRGFGKDNSVLNNKIRGRANAALSVLHQNAGTPTNNSFIANDLDGFNSSLSDIFIDTGATNTFVVGRRSSMEDRGIGTILVQMP